MLCAWRHLVVLDFDLSFLLPFFLILWLVLSQPRLFWSQVLRQLHWTAISYDDRVEPFLTGRCCSGIVKADDKKPSLSQHTDTQAKCKLSSC